MTSQTPKNMKFTYISLCPLLSNHQSTEDHTKISVAPLSQADEHSNYQVVTNCDHLFGQDKNCKVFSCQTASDIFPATVLQVPSFFIQLMNE